MRRPVARKAAKPLAKPTYFPPKNCLTRTLPPELAAQREFEEYHFRHFDFSQTQLPGRRFNDCLFESCNLAGVSLSRVSLQNVAFVGCKLLGLEFNACPDLLFGVHFEQCQLDYASFYGKKMPYTRFVDCSLQEANFTETDLTGVDFQRCQLRRAVFHHARLLGADFRTAQEVALDPEVNELKEARFALPSLPGLLTKYGLVID